MGKRSAMPPSPMPEDRERAARIFDILAARAPDPTPAYPAATPYELLVTVTVSAQATDQAVLRATKPLFAVAATPAAMLELGQEALETYLRPIGLQRVKARAVIAAARMIEERFGGTVPLDRQGLESLPGVGRKTAGIVLHRLGIERAIAVDTHVYRVAHRLRLATAGSAGAVERELMAIVPADRLAHAHDWLVLHGKSTCHAQRPACNACAVRHLCPSYGTIDGST